MVDHNFSKTAIITGGSRGIGKAISEKLAQKGYKIVINYISDNLAAKETYNQCKKYTDKVELVKADVSNAEDVRRLVNITTDTFGSIDVLINNAGINIDRMMLDMKEEEWDKVVDVNMKSVFLMAKYASMVMQKQEETCNIINMAAITGIQGRIKGINYCSSKAGVIVMTKCLALELAPKIRVNCVIPGFTFTQETAGRFNLPQNLDHEISTRKLPLKRIGSPDDIANMICFLISDEAKHITGQKFIVDGGEYMY